MSASVGLRAPVLLGPGEDERARGRVDASRPSSSNVRAPGHDEVELLVLAGAVAQLVVRLDHLVAGVVARVGVDAERR